MEASLLWSEQRLLRLVSGFCGLLFHTRRMNPITVATIGYGISTQCSLGSLHANAL